MDDNSATDDEHNDYLELINNARAREQDLEAEVSRPAQT